MGLFNLFGKSAGSKKSIGDLPATETSIFEIGEWFVFLRCGPGVYTLFIFPVNGDADEAILQDFPEGLTVEAVVVMNYADNGQYWLEKVWDKLVLADGCRWMITHAANLFPVSSSAQLPAPTVCEAKNFVRELSFFRSAANQNFLLVEYFNPERNENDVWLIGHQIDFSWKALRPHLSPGLRLRFFGNLTQSAFSQIAEQGYTHMVTNRKGSYVMVLSHILAGADASVNQAIYGEIPGFTQILQGNPEEKPDDWEDFPEEMPADAPAKAHIFADGPLKRTGNAMIVGEFGLLLVPAGKYAYALLVLPIWQDALPAYAFTKINETLAHNQLGAVIFLNILEGGQIHYQTVLDNLPSRPQRVFFAKNAPEELLKALPSQTTAELLPAKLKFPSMVVEQLADSPTYLRVFTPGPAHNSISMMYVGTEICPTEADMAFAVGQGTRLRIVGTMDREALPGFTRMILERNYLLDAQQQQYFDLFCLDDLPGADEAIVSDALAHMGFQSYKVGNPAP